MPVAHCRAVLMMPTFSTVPHDHDASRFHRPFPAGARAPRRRATRPAGAALAAAGDHHSRARAAADGPDGSRRAAFLHQSIAVRAVHPRPRPADARRPAAGRIGIARPHAVSARTTGVGRRRIAIAAAVAGVLAAADAGEGRGVCSRGAVGGRIGAAPFPSHRRDRPRRFQRSTARAVARTAHSFGRFAGTGLHQVRRDVRRNAGVHAEADGACLPVDRKRRPGRRGRRSRSAAGPGAEPSSAGRARSVAHALSTAGFRTPAESLVAGQGMAVGRTAGSCAADAGEAAREGAARRADRRRRPRRRTWQ